MSPPVQLQIPSSGVSTDLAPKNKVRALPLRARAPSSVVETDSFRLAPSFAEPPPIAPASLACVDPRPPLARPYRDRDDYRHRGRRGGPVLAKRSCPDQARRRGPRER